MKWGRRHYLRDLGLQVGSQCMVLLRIPDGCPAGCSAATFTLTGCVSVRGWWGKGEESLPGFIVVFIAGRSTAMEVLGILS